VILQYGKNPKENKDYMGGGKQDVNSETHLGFSTSHLDKEMNPGDARGY
jgi:hypothetical protein